MPHIYCLKCYLTRPDFERVKQAAFAAKHRTMSSYARQVLTGNTLLIEQKIMENNTILKEIRDKIIPLDKQKQKLYKKAPHTKTQHQ